MHVLCQKAPIDQVILEGMPREKSSDDERELFYCLYIRGLLMTMTDQKSA